MDQKKGLHLEICADFHEFRGETTKKRVSITKSKKTVLAHEFWGDNQCLGSPRPWTALQWHRASYFRLGTTLARGAQFLFGGHKQWFWGHGPQMPPEASGLLQNYRNLSNCNCRIFVKEILLEIGFIEEMRTTVFVITKTYPKPFSTISFIRENTI